jgi:hypothetical protein
MVSGQPWGGAAEFKAPCQGTLQIQSTFNIQGSKTFQHLKKWMCNCLTRELSKQTYNIEKGISIQISFMPGRVEVKDGIQFLLPGTLIMQHSPITLSSKVLSCSDIHPGQPLIPMLRTPYAVPAALVIPPDSSVPSQHGVKHLSKTLKPES